MIKSSSDTNTGITFYILKTYIVPAFFLFVIPLCSLWFFDHVQTSYDQQGLANIEQSIQHDNSMNEQEKADALEFFRQMPISQMLASSDPRFDQLRGGISSDLQFRYKIFRWMILLSLISVISGVAVFLIAGLSVLCSLRSQTVQYYSLSVSWHLLRIFATVQVLIQGCLAVALSFWVTAFWAEVYYIKLIVIAAVLALGAAFAVIAAIFKRINETFEVEGVVIEQGTNSQLWQDLERICSAVGTAAPDQIVAGIDTNFFVTEHPIIVNEKMYKGRTLFVSLSLLRVLHGSDADAVMAHEMAHFSGNDTLYSKKISPLLNRYGIYLTALQEGGGISKPVFYFMLCFRSLFEISLRRLGRQRELRADRIAADIISPHALARSLLKISAYSDYRMQVEELLFSTDQRLTTVDIPSRVQDGFPDFATAFVQDSQYLEGETAHPFDSHPPMEQRLEALGIQFTSDGVLSLLQEQADRRWYQHLDRAEEIEAQQWTAFEERFKQIHEHVLAYRYLPETEEERQVVLKYFPGVTFEKKKNGTLVIDYEKITYSDWKTPLRFDEIKDCTAEKSTLGHPQLRFNCTRKELGKRILRLDIFQVGQDSVLNALNEYYSRHLAMIEYRKENDSSQRQAGGCAGCDDVGTSINPVTKMN